ncbi:MAG: exopolysaccharide biosynthesis protein [Proteobacteria bacterium]|nr:exopolysaccharide biosynthesis protein [Pseudomonadota bacterium]
MSRAHAPRTSAVLQAALDAQPGEQIRLGDLVEPLHERAFGFLLLVLALPNFVPVPIGIGGPMGVLTALVGLQMLLGLSRPWLPRRVADYRFARSSAGKVLGFSKPLLTRLEKLASPRLEILTHRRAGLFSGLLLVVVGVLLALPIPFTNWPIGVLLLLYGIALMERDGALLLAAWLLSLLGIGVFASASGALVHYLRMVFF